jgi:hypothetical protein
LNKLGEKMPSIKNMPWGEILDLADLLHEKGLDEEEVVAEISEMLDALIDFSVIIPNPAVGVALEAVDGLIFTAALRIAVSISKKNPELRAERKQKRALKVKNLSKLRMKLRRE